MGIGLGAMAAEQRGGVTRERLEQILSRPITINGLSFSPQQEDDFRMVERLRPTFLGRVAYIWGNPWDDEGDYFKEMQKVAARVNAIDPDMIVQACVFEAVYTGVDSVPIPAWAFEAFDLPVEERTFRYEDMLFEDGRFVDQWGPGGSVPDISRPETKMWFYYRARSYIDAGYDAIHLGQIQLIGNTDPGYKNWKVVIDRIRDHAAEHARLGFVLLDAHVVVVDHPLPKVDGTMLLDFLSFPLRPVEKPESPQEAILEMGHADTIYGRSPSAYTPSGWYADPIPYLVEFDNTHASGQEGEQGLGTPWVWGYEEVTWLAHQPAEYSNQWLRYAYDWLNENDPNGNLQMPGSIPMGIHRDGERLWYRANTRSEASPDSFGQEDAIYAIWHGNDE